MYDEGMPRPREFEPDEVLDSAMQQFWERGTGRPRSMTWSGRPGWIAPAKLEGLDCRLRLLHQGFLPYVIVFLEFSWRQVTVSRVEPFLVVPCGVPELRPWPLNVSIRKSREGMLKCGVAFLGGAVGLGWEVC